MHPVVGEQRPLSQETATPPPQAPAVQVSVVTHRFPLLQAVPSGAV